MTDALLLFVTDNEIGLPATLTGLLLVLVAARALGRLTLPIPGDDWAPPPVRGE